MFLNLGGHLSALTLHAVMPVLLLDALPSKITIHSLVSILLLLSGKVLWKLKDFLMDATIAVVLLRCSFAVFP